MKTVNNLTHEEAFSILETVYHLLQEDKMQASICIVGRNSNIITQLIMDNVRPVTANVAMLKARQSAGTAETTGWMRDKIKNEEYSLEVFNIEKSKYVPWAGGVPIFSKGKILIGGIGICNLPEKEDEFYAIKAVEESGFLTSRI